MAETGTAEVKLFILKNLKLTDQFTKLNNNPKKTFNNTYFIIQAGAFTVKDNALKILKTLRSILPDNLFIIKHGDGFFKVISEEKYLNQKTDEIMAILNRYDIHAYKKRVFNF